MFNYIMLMSVLEKLNTFNESIFTPIDNLINKIPAADWVIDGICDSIHLIPFLFVVFLIIEIIEFYWADRINSLLKKSNKAGIPIGALAAVFPQCGFSVIASTLYSKRIITLGVLIAVYLSTSDETIPILLSMPSKTHLIIPIVGIKLLIGICFGYIIDFLLPKTTSTSEISDINEFEEGCCKHDIEHPKRREILVHPVLHTINVWGFILVITLILNYCLENTAITELINGNRFIQPVIASFVGLIPNCAISIGITMMLVKDTITFGAAVSGLLANSGLGLLVLLKNNDFKDTLRIVIILLSISMLSGIVINLFI